MIDIFDNKIDLTKVVCHSGGAPGADTEWEVGGDPFGVKTYAKILYFIPGTGYEVFMQRGKIIQ